MRLALLAAALLLAACAPPPPVYRGVCAPIAEQVLGCVFRPMAGPAADDQAR